MAENVTLTWWSFVNQMCTFPVNFSWILGSNLDWDWWKTLGLASFIHPFHSLVVSFHQGFHSSKNQKFNFTFTRFEFLFDRCFIFQEEQFIFLFDKQIFLLFVFFHNEQNSKGSSRHFTHFTFCIFVYVFLESRALDMVHYFKKGVLCLTIPFWSNAHYGNVCIFLRQFSTNT